MAQKKIREICSFIGRGITPVYSESGVLILNQKCIRSNRVSFDKAQYTSDSKAYSKEKYVKRNDILINSTGTGTLGRVALYDKKECALCDSHITIVRTIERPDKETYVCPRFVDYYLHLNESVIESFGKGSTNQIELAAKDIGQINIELPAQIIQDKTVSILSAYDNLIEVNNKRIKVLEQMAENLYKEWFVRFRFPGHETAEFYESRIGKLPRAFQVMKNKDVYEYYIGGGWGNDDEDKEYSVPAYVIRGTDFPRVKRGDISSCPLRYHKASNFSARKLKANDIIIEVSGGTAEQPVGRALIVTQDVIDRLMGRVICASFCKQVRVNSAAVSPLYYYYWMKFLYDTRIIDRFQLQSTGIINFQFEFFINNGEVMLPPIELMQQFDSLVLPIMDQISIIAKQNENLIKQRDLLLPRLMSGKLEV
jgi:type I restriction enzyme S subunit